LEKLIEEMRRIVVEESKKVEQLDRKLNGDDRRYGDWNPKRWEARQTPDATRDLRRMQREIGNAIDELMPSLLD
jgi:uncharacterized coiled-coil protein SlyX